MNKKAQVVIVSLWILSLLTVLAVSLGFRASMGIKLSRGLMDKTKSFALAKAGLNEAIREIQQDDNDYDGLDESWVDNEEDFKDIRFSEHSPGFATVSYSWQDEGFERITYGVVDEERKININTAPKELLTALIHKSGGSAAQELAENICAWRGDSGTKITDTPEQDYQSKRSAFSTTEELLLVKGMTEDVYAGLKNHITVWGEGYININTAPEFILDVLIEYSRKKITSGENNPGDLKEQIIAVRPVSSLGDLNDKLRQKKPLTSAQLNVLNVISERACVRSQYFHIKACGKITRSNIRCEIECVINRDDEKLVYWHES